MIRLTFKYIPEDGGDFLRDSRISRGNQTIGVLGGIVFLFLLGGAIYAAMDGRYRDSLWILLFGAPFATYTARSFGYLAPRGMEMPSQVADERKVEISPAEINFDSSSARKTKTWDEFATYLETKKLILLYQKDLFVRMIPKRVILPGQLSEIRQILKAKLPERRGPRKSRLIF